jgi:hypothetical protein
MPRNPERQILHHLAEVDAVYVLLVIVAYVANVGRSRSSRKAGSFGR